MIEKTLEEYGAPILNYQLYVNQGVNGSPFAKITDYDGQSPTYQMKRGDTIGTFTVTVGGLYRFKTTATNSIGTS
jgi:hypothetical protein